MISIAPLMLALAATAQQPAAPQWRPPTPAAAQQAAATRAMLDARAQAASILKDAYAAADQATREEEFTAVLAECAKALRMKPERKWVDYAHRLEAFAYDKRGELRSEAGDELAALDDFSHAIERNPRRWQAAHNRAVSHAMLGNFEQAMADFERTIRLRPQYPNAYFNRAELRREAGQLPLAVADYDRALELNPLDFAALVGRGQTRMKLNQLDTALADCQTVLEVNPADPAALVLRGDVHRRQGKYREAADDYQAAIDADPMYAAAYQSAAWLLATCSEARVRSPETAITYAEKARELIGKDEPALLDVLAAAHAAAGDYRQARKVQAQALALAPNTAAFRQRQRMYEQQRPYREGAPASPPQARVAEQRKNWSPSRK